MMMFTQVPVRRLLASGLIAAVMLAYPIPLIGGHIGVLDCPSALRATNGVPVLGAATGGGACAHTDAVPCLSMVGCFASAPACQSHGLSFVVHTPLVVTGILSAPALGDLYRTGPPTPPPNQI